MFWVDVRHFNSLLSKHLHIFILTSENILYWVDAAADTISAINLETNKILVLWTDDKAHFFSIDVIGHYLYVSDWMKK